MFYSENIMLGGFYCLGFLFTLYMLSLTIQISQTSYDMREATEIEIFL